MKPKSKHNYYSKPDDSSFLWNWKEHKNKRSKNSGNQFPVTEFLQDNYRKLEENVVGPGAGLGIGCGFGFGLGLVGGVGYGGWPWNHVKFVYGFGMGCGLGLGFGYGRGLGYGRSLDSLQSDLFD
ncbi:glycine-rich protein 5 [Ricinus communis]|uniref:Glycine-rich protein n=1 Tax=Ricinus communis TaxID=3988 RepID=B9SQ04_RICCO|nr:glycine-rich protein 5 [Ricinus communis]EEF34323.1 conserved hypothetical protein [Ricinus communis]